MNKIEMLEFEKNYNHTKNSILYEPNHYHPLADSSHYIASTYFDGGSEEFIGGSSGTASPLYPHFISNMI